MRIFLSLSTSKVSTSVGKWLRDLKVVLIDFSDFFVKKKKVEKVENNNFFSHCPSLFTKWKMCENDLDHSFVLSEIQLVKLSKERNQRREAHSCLFKCFESGPTKGFSLGQESRSPKDDEYGIRIGVSPSLYCIMHNVIISKNIIRRYIESSFKIYALFNDISEKIANLSIWRHDWKFVKRFVSIYRENNENESDRRCLSIAPQTRDTIPFVHSANRILRRSITRD